MIPIWLLTVAYYLSFAAGALVLALIAWHYSRGPCRDD